MSLSCCACHPRPRFLGAPPGQPTCSCLRPCGSDNCAPENPRPVHRQAPSVPLVRRPRRKAGTR